MKGALMLANPYKDTVEVVKTVGLNFSAISILDIVLVSLKSVSVE